MKKRYVCDMSNKTFQLFARYLWAPAQNFARRDDARQPRPAGPHLSPTSSAVDVNSQGFRLQSGLQNVLKAQLPSPKNGHNFVDRAGTILSIQGHDIPVVAIRHCEGSVLLEAGRRLPVDHDSRRWKSGQDVCLDVDALREVHRPRPPHRHNSEVRVPSSSSRHRVTR